MSNNIKRVFIMDMENTNNFNFLKKYEVSKKDEVILFLSDNSRCIPPKDLTYILDNEINIKSEYVSVGTKNAMDFQMVAYISLNVKSNKQYYIVSDDKGFEVAANYIKYKTNKKIEIINQEVETIKATEILSDEDSIKNEILSIISTTSGSEDFKNKVKKLNLQDRRKIHNELVAQFGEKGKEIYQLIKPKLTA